MIPFPGQLALPAPEWLEEADQLASKNLVTVAVTVIIPTLNAERHIPSLQQALAQQRLPHSVTIIDSSSEDTTAALAERAGWDVIVIPRSDFGHGKTRNQAAQTVQTDLMLFLSQDVLPATPDFLERLVAPILVRKVAASYARQVAAAGATPPEKFLREYNYPPVSRIRSADDIAKMGLQAFFFSNAASAFDREVFLRLGGFPENTIQNEDMILCARLLRGGHKVAYVAEAVAYHTHNYSLGQQFRRYFDTGVAIREARDDLRVGASTVEGPHFVRQQLAWLRRMGYIGWIPRAVAESAAKFIGYSLGKRHRSLPIWLKRRISLNTYYWT
jgi:rhamnosyltransferase